MKKTLNLANWILDKKFPNQKRLVEVSIHLKYPNTKPLLPFKPSERKKKINQDQKDKFRKLISTGFFNEYELIGTSKKPRGLKTTVAYSSLEKLDRLNYLSYIFIHKVDKAKKLKPAPTRNYYCVKMIIAIEIEGRRKGDQTFEERFVLIKARSFEDAYKKLEKTKDDYSEPYLNSDGQLVRWKFESFEDCYATDITGSEDLNNPKGVEVFSALKTRKLTKARRWNGK